MFGLYRPGGWVQTTHLQNKLALSSSLPQPSNVGDSLGKLKSRGVKPSGDIQETTLRLSKQTMHGSGPKHSFHACSQTAAELAALGPPATLHSHPHLSRALPKVEEWEFDYNQSFSRPVHGDAMGDMDEKWWKALKCQSASLQKIFEIDFQNSAEEESTSIGLQIFRTLAHKRHQKAHRPISEEFAHASEMTLFHLFGWCSELKREKTRGNYIRFHVDKGHYHSILSKHQLLHSLPGDAQYAECCQLEGWEFWKNSNFTSIGMINTLIWLAAIACFPEASDCKDERISRLNFGPRHVLCFYNLRSSSIIGTSFSSLPVRFQVAVANPNHPNPGSGQCDILSSVPGQLAVACGHLTALTATSRSYPYDMDPGLSKSWPPKPRGRGKSFRPLNITGISLGSLSR